jgi:hypothetical protein
MSPCMVSMDCTETPYNGTEAARRQGVSWLSHVVWNLRIVSYSISYRLSLSAPATGHGAVGYCAAIIETCILESPFMEASQIY